MSKWTKVEVPIFFITLYIKFSKDFKKDAKKVGVKCSKTKYLGLAFKTSKKGRDEYCILLRTKDNSVIAHEALHIVNFILRDLELEVNSKNDEIQAYLLGWVVKQVNKVR